MFTVTLVVIVVNIDVVITIVIVNIVITIVVIMYIIIITNTITIVWFLRQVRQPNSDSLWGFSLSHALDVVCLHEGLPFVEQIFQHFVFSQTVSELVYHGVGVLVGEGVHAVVIGYQDDTHIAEESEHKWDTK